ncbi:hypothetical protein [Campylobacter fetus]|nr:hypothetical protein [Campylobacter fetus]OCR94010.1 hypothetical protein CFT12S02842_06710 [Campylobacter fetus subsp. testudinum]
MTIKELIGAIKESEFVKGLTEFCKDNKIVFIIIGLIIIFMACNHTLWQIFDGAVTLITAVAVLINISIQASNKKKNLEKIKVYFETNGVKEQSPRFEIIRKDFTRSEIAGYLSFFTKDTVKRYSIEYLKEQNFFDDIYKVQEGKLNEVVIKITDGELEAYEYNI